jgi:hypothetical protein
MTVTTEEPAASKLSEEEIAQIVKLLKEGKRLPSDYRPLLFETKKESELVYSEKEREEDILADTMAVRVGDSRRTVPSVQ